MGGMEARSFRFNMIHVTGPIMRGRVFAIIPSIMAEFSSAVPGITAHFTTATFAAAANIGIKDAGIAVLCVRAQDFAGISRAGPVATTDTIIAAVQGAGLDGGGGEAATDA